MGIYIFTTKRLVRELIRDSKSDKTSRDFGKNIIPSMVNEGHKVFSFPFRDERTGEPGYWRDIGTLDSFYAANLDLVQPKPQFDLYDRNWQGKSYCLQVIFRKHSLIDFFIFKKYGMCSVKIIYNFVCIRI